MDAPEPRWLTLQWHITHRCNLRCAHCYQTEYAAFSSPEALKRTADDYVSLLQSTGRTGFVNVTGGEPLTHPALFGLLGDLKARGIPFGLLTNGTLIGRREARQLRMLGVDYVQVSLDGMEKTHDRIRGEGSFLRAADGLSFLLAEGIDATVAFTAQSENRGELPKLARFCRDVGVKKIWFDRVVIPADADGAGLALSQEEAQRLMKTGARLSKSCPVSCQRALQFLYARGQSPYRCTAGESQLAILADGTVLPCRRLPLPLGRLPQDTLTQIWRDSPVLKALAAHSAPEGCLGCPHAETCGGGAKCIAMAKTGDWRVPDPDCPVIRSSAGG